MELTWVAIIASLLMGSAALLVFVWAVHNDHFRNFEDVKHQVFWSDVQERVDIPHKEQQNAGGVKSD